MELKIFASLDLVILFSLVGGAIAAGVEEPVENGEEDSSLDGELEASSLQQLLDDMLAAGQLPEPLEDQGRADVPNRDGREPALGMLGKQENRAGQAGTRAEHGVELAAFFELIESSQSCHDPLSAAPALPAVLDNLVLCHSLILGLASFADLSKLVGTRRFPCRSDTSSVSRMKSGTTFGGSSRS